MRLRTLFPLPLLLLLAPQNALADGDAQPTIQLTSLNLMLKKGLITQDEYNTAVQDVATSSGTKAMGDTNTIAVGKFGVTIYGFTELDAIHDSTESFVETMGGTQVARNETFAGQHGRLQGSIRNSRLGVRVKVPEFHGVRVSGQLEMDFLGLQPNPGYYNAVPANGSQTTPTTTNVPAFVGSEASFYANPTFRARHVNVKIETPVLDFLLGQYWSLFGFQPYFHPNTVDIQGVPGQLYSRRPQLRISKTIKTAPLNVDIAIAALDPIQRDSEAPESQAGLRLVINPWKGRTTNGSTGTLIQPAQIAVSGDLKYVKVQEFSPTPHVTNDAFGGAIAVNAFLPLIPCGENAGNCLSFTGEFADGYGTADQYTSTSGGVGFPALPNPLNLLPAPVYPQDIDNGIVSFNAQNQLHYIQWYSGIVGLQYYLPGTRGKVWVSVNYSHMESPNAKNYGAATKIRQSLDWIDGNIFIDPVPGVRIGLGYSREFDNYVDGQQAINDRVQGSGFLIF